MTSDFSLLSVVHASDDFAAFKKSFASVAASQLQPSEWVLVCNGALPQEFHDFFKAAPQDFALKLIKTDEASFSAALNLGLQYCAFEMVARFDADDMVYPERFLQQVEFMQQNPAVDILSSCASVIDENDKLITTRNLPSDHATIAAKLWTCPIIHPATMYKKSIVLAAGGYDEAMHRAEDFDLWVRLYKQGAKFANIATPLLHYRQTAVSYKKNSWRASLTRVKIALAANRASRNSLWVALFCWASLVRVILPYKLNYFLYNRLANFIRS